MGMCCEEHLLRKVRECMKLAKDNEVTVEDILNKGSKCDYCTVRADFIVTYNI